MTIHYFEHYYKLWLRFLKHGNFIHVITLFHIFISGFATFISLEFLLCLPTIEKTIKMCTKQQLTDNYLCWNRNLISSMILTSLVVCTVKSSLDYCPFDINLKSKYLRNNLKFYTDILNQILTKIEIVSFSSKVFTVCATQSNSGLVIFWSDYSKILDWITCCGHG